MEPTDPRVEQPRDPNAPKVLNIAHAHQLVRNADKWLRNPGGAVIAEIAGQLGCALAALGEVDTKIVSAQNNAMRYQREAEQANKDVLAMQAEVATAREQVAKLTAEVELLRPKPKKPKESTEPVVTSLVALKARKKPGPKPKIVPMQQAQ